MHIYKEMVLCACEVTVHYFVWKLPKPLLTSEVGAATAIFSEHTIKVWLEVAAL